MAQQVRQTRPIYVKVQPVDDPKARKAYSSERPYCIFCGVSAAEVRRRDGGVPLQCHHIIRFCRSDELCNFAMTCWREHGLIHDEQFRDAHGELLPKLTLGHVLMLKSIREPELYDPARLAVLFGKPLPSLLPVPDFIETEYRKNRPHPYRPWVEWKEPEIVTVPIIAEDEPNIVGMADIPTLPIKRTKGDRRCPRCIRLNMTDARRNCPACARIQKGE